MIPSSADHHSVLYPFSFEFTVNISSVFSFFLSFSLLWWRSFDTIYVSFVPGTACITPSLSHNQLLDPQSCRSPIGSLDIVSVHPTLKCIYSIIITTKWNTHLHSRDTSLPPPHIYWWTPHVQSRSLKGWQRVEDVKWQITRAQDLPD